jgi:cobalamin biosynthesis Mg chelatase CobN
MNANLNLSQMIDAATQNDIARAALQTAESDPMHFLAFVVVGVVVVAAMVAGYSVRQYRAR